MNHLNYSNIFKIFQFKFVRDEPSQTNTVFDTTEDNLGIPKEGNFKLLRHFSLSSLTFFLIAIGILNYSYRQSAFGDLLAMGERENAALAKSLANSLWANLNPYLDESEGLSAEQLRDRQQISVLQGAIEEQTRGLSIVKVKVYNLEGQTIFSTDEQQIEEDKSQSDGFLSAVTGKVRTQLDHRDTFTAIRGEITDRNLLASYVPIQSNNSRDWKQSST